MKYSTWIKRIGIGLVVLLVIGGFAWALRETPVLVDVATVADGPMAVTVREEGITRVRRVYTVSAPVSGQLSRTLLEEGDVVYAGATILASIQPLEPPLLDSRTRAELVAARDAAAVAVDVARLDLGRAATALAQAESDLDRQTQLGLRGLVSDSALQRLTSETAMARAQHDAAASMVAIREAELRSVEARLAPDGDDAAARCCVAVEAPVDGMVLAVHARSEQAVTLGTPIADIGDPTDLEVSVALLSSDAVRIGPGTPATITDWGGDAALGAVVRRVEPAAFTRVSALGVEEQRVNVALSLSDTDPRLGHGYRVFAELVVWDCAQCLQVPIGALFRLGSDWALFVLDGDRLAERRVGIGRMNDEVAQVLDGLAPGDRVVLHPSDTLAAGTLVEERKL